MPIFDDPLEQALAAQEMAKKAAPAPPVDPTDPVLQQALKLLPAYDGQVSYETVAPKGKIHRTPTEAVAWVDSTRPGVVSVPNWTDTYRKAAAGDNATILKLAATLAHERYHLSHGPDEGPAYDEQIQTLIQLGAPKELIEKARKSRAHVTGQK